jgi:hypothetical protein
MMTQHSIEEKTLPELKQLALDELGLTREAVKQFGDLRQRSTWINVIAQAYKDGKTTKAYQELPIIQATTLSDNSNDSEEMSDNTADDDLVELSVVPWLHDLAAQESIEQLFSQKHSLNLIISPPLLECWQEQVSRFSCYKDWMHPGKFIEVYPIGLAQVLFFTTGCNVYYIPFKDNRIHRQRLNSFIEFATPTCLTHQRAVEYVNKLHKVVTVGDIATSIV